MAEIPDGLIGDDELPYLPEGPSIKAALESDLAMDYIRLDALLAVSILGWIGVHQKHTGAWYAYKPGIVGVPGKPVPSVIPNPTTNERDCKLLLTKMQEKGKTVLIVWDQRAGLWACRWTDLEGEVYRAEAKSMELAISRAAAKKYWAEIDTKRDDNIDNTSDESPVR